VTEVTLVLQSSLVAAVGGPLSARKLKSSCRAMWLLDP